MTKTDLGKEYVFALAGNPNSGKTTLFNELTGSHYQVGNWAGVTVERKEGICKYVFHNHITHFDTHEHESEHKHDESHNHIRIVDLPGIYSLSPNSAEEVITRDYIIKEKPDLILNIVDATNLERNLYLTTQLAEMETPMIIALNMMDALESNGAAIDIEALEKKIGIKIMPISASKGRGVQDLVTAALETAAHHEVKCYPVSYKPHIEKAVREIKELENVPRLCAIKILENDERLSSNIQNEKTYDIIKNTNSLVTDMETYFADERYRFIRSAAHDAVTKTGPNKQAERTKKIDAVVNHPALAIPIFIGIMFLIFQITFGAFGTMLSDLVDTLFNVHFASLVSGCFERWNVSSFLTGLVVDGIISGVGGVVTFFPQIMLLFLFLSFLEDSGYMARTAFIMDKLFVKLGLSGKSFVPMIMGFGCSVPAIMSVRTLENERDRKLTLLLIPFMSCGAKMPVYAIFTAALFPNHAGIVTFSLYFLGIILGILSGIIFSKTVLKGDIPPFVLELPPYRMPTLKSTFHHMWDKAKDFAVRAGTVLLLASIIIWLLQNLDLSLHMVSDSRDSIIGHIGRIIAPVFTPCGFGNWQAAVSLISGFAAKEAVVSTMSILYGVNSTTGLVSSLSQVFTPLSAYSFLVFVLLYVPCVAAVSALKTELNSKKLTFFSVCWQIGAAWIMSALVYQIGSLFV
ncbi:MAG: ferrous iron transport protein B [Clostridia bacterium]|nr:ferrous iron transport protein B [Clostridia bacterium]